MTEYTLKYTPSLLADNGTFRLLELPSDLCKVVETALDDIAESASLQIKGNPNEDAVLCTAEKTYTIRSVVLSNSVLVVTPGSSSMNGPAGGESDEVVIRDQLNEILELVPSLPRLHKLDALLRGREYDEGHEDDEDRMSDGEQSRLKNRGKFSYEDAREMLQASDAELNRGLQNRRVLVLNGNLRPLASSYLTTILELLLTQLVSLSLPYASAPVEELCSTIEEEYDIRKDVSQQVISWFGKITAGKWAMDVAAVVKEIGLGILRAYKDDPIDKDEFLTKWHTTVGDTFESTVSLDLLSGNYLSQIDTMKVPPMSMLTYFPASELPNDPAARFTDLFLTRPRWKAEEIEPFLTDIVVDNKERDRLLLKYTRAITDSEGIWYTTRAKYNG